MANARQKIEEAEQEAVRYREVIREFEEQKASLLTAAQEAAAEERIKLTTQAKSDVDIMAKSWDLEIEREKSEFQDNLRRELMHLITATSQKVLSDLVGLTLEQAFLAKFLDRLQSISEEEKRLFLESGNRSAILASSFRLSNTEKAHLSKTIKQGFGQNVTLSYEPLPESVCGLALCTPAFTLEWRIESYIADFERQLDEAFRSARSPDAG